MNVGKKVVRIQIEIFSSPDNRMDYKEFSLRKAMNLVRKQIADEEVELDFKRLHYRAMADDENKVPDVERSMKWQRLLIEKQKINIALLYHELDGYEEQLKNLQKVDGQGSETSASSWAYGRKGEEHSFDD